jgi:ATP-dependent HslUV protease ATP-binding subunit HslU
MTFVEIPNFSPREIVSELDRFIIGQNDAKKAVAIAMRNRWRRGQLSDELKEEVLPKNILMVGPTGCGKTEIARRLAKLAQAPFIKVEATKFTEVGYVGRDVEQIIRDMTELAIKMHKEKARNQVKTQAEKHAEDRILKALLGKKPSQETLDIFRKKLKNGELEDKEIDIDIEDDKGPEFAMQDIPGMPGGSMGMMNLGDLLGKSLGTRMVTKKMTIEECRKILVNEESDKLYDQDKVVRKALYSVENHGIVFIDEIDKICTTMERRGDISREGVQRDLLPLLEGCSVNTKHGTVKTDHILFICSGAFHLSKPSDLLPELQGRLPIRVELSPLTKADFKRILLETENSLLKQYEALLKTEQVTLTFKESAVDQLADLSMHINENVENIGARRLHTLMEKLLEEISFHASDAPNTTHIIDGDFVKTQVGDLAQDEDLGKFIL